MTSLYVITNRALTGNRPLLSVLQDTVNGGVNAIILREKDMVPRDLYKLACRIKEICAGTATKLIINSSVEVALACDADGAHLGYGSLPLQAVRKMLPGKVIGVSVHNPAEAMEAKTYGADYLLAGHVFPTASKPGKPEKGTDFIKQLSSNTTLPIIAIGGIVPGNANTVIQAGAAGIAVMSWIMDSEDVRGKIRELRQALTKQS